MMGVFFDMTSEIFNIYNMTVKLNPYCLNNLNSFVRLDLQNIFVKNITLLLFYFNICHEYLVF